MSSSLVIFRVLVYLTSREVEGSLHVSVGPIAGAIDPPQNRLQVTRAANGPGRRTPPIHPICREEEYSRVHVML